MSPKYDKSIQISRQEEGSYHEREFTPINPKSYTKETFEVVPVKERNYDSDSSHDEVEQWTKSKVKVNHKTRQVETRVRRQLLVEDGKVIADSGPLVTTRITEDNKEEEREKEKAPKNKSKFEALENAPVGENCSGRVLGEKKEVRRFIHEVREENKQYHDERFKELTGHDVHRRAIQAPHELISLDERGHSSGPRGKMVHYSNKGKKYQDTDVISEVSKVDNKGSITKEVKRTKHHEEFSDDERPDEKGEAEALMQAPISTISTRRHADTVQDFSDLEDDHGKFSSGHRSSNFKRGQGESFPKYKIDPLLNSIDDDDFGPSYDSRDRSSTLQRTHALRRKESFSSSSSDDNERPTHQTHRTIHGEYRTSSPTVHDSMQRGRPVEIPDEYKINRQQTDKATKHGHQKSTIQHHERSFSPPPKSHLSHKSSKSHRSHKEDASVQAHLSDEEVEEKRSLSSGGNSHERTAKHLQRQSANTGSRRFYYYGKDPHPKSPQSVHSYSSSSLSDAKDKTRQQGVRSRDSGFKSPQSMRTPTPISGRDQQIYSVSNKSKQRQGATSPTPTAASLGQRSVKTTTTTLSANLEDRSSKPSRSAHEHSGADTRGKRASEIGRKGSKATQLTEADLLVYNQDGCQSKTDYTSGSNRKQLLPIHVSENEVEDESHQSLSNCDSVSLQSLGPNATTIKVPYKQEVPHYAKIQPSYLRPVKTASGEMDFQQRLDNMRNRSLLSESDHEYQDDRLRQLNERKSNQTIVSDDQQVKRDHFNYRTIIKNVQPVLPIPKQHVVTAYNVRVIDHRSPFHLNSMKSMSELTSSIARLELLSGECGSLNHEATDLRATDQNCQNNNEANFNLNEFVKYHAEPVFADSADSLDVDDDRASQFSSSSMRSCRTYHVRSSKNAEKQMIGEIEQDLNDETDFPVKIVKAREVETDLKQHPSAWIFDLTNGSSTVIQAPPKPEKPALPQVNSTELAESRGGRSYYLEVKEHDGLRPSNLGDHQDEPAPIKTALYSRWTSQGALSQPSGASKCLSSTPDTTRKPRSLKPTTLNHAGSRPSLLPSESKARGKLPLVTGNPLTASDRSKSSSCLMSSNKASKYSIYGGLKQANETGKSVPRLSYSRPIGPKAQRQVDTQPKLKAPSRYLKMK